MKTELAWAAGFLDGEGTFCISWRKNKKSTKSYGYFRICASQSHRKVFDRLKKIIGGSVTGPYPHSRGKSYFQFCLSKNAENMFWKLFPYLSKVKRLQGGKAI